MPDGDRIHSKLGRLYQMPYRCLCENKASLEEFAQLLMKALKKDLLNKGNLPIQLAKDVAKIFSSMEASKINSDNHIDWNKLNMAISQLMFRSDGSHHLKSLVLRATNTIIHEYRYQNNLDANNISRAIIRQYIFEVYESEFKGRIPLVEEHHMKISSVQLNTRIENIELSLKSRFSLWAKSMEKNDCIKSRGLKIPSIKKDIDLDEDLLA